MRSGPDSKTRRYDPSEGLFALNGSAEAQPAPIAGQDLEAEATAVQFAFKWVGPAIWTSG